MKVRCINELSYEDITLDKTYKVSYEENGGYYMEDDTEGIFYYEKMCFEVICQSREELELENRIAILEKEIKEREKKLRDLVKYRNELIKEGII